MIFCLLYNNMYTHIQNVTHTTAAIVRLMMLKLNTNAFAKEFLEKKYLSTTARTHRNTKASYT